MADSSADGRSTGRTNTDHTDHTDGADGADGRTARRTRTGLGRVLIAVYAVWALAATARSAVQIVDRFESAPLAFVLSAVAAVFYVVATVTLARGDRGSRRLATVSCALELAGVLVIGTVSLIRPDLFPEPTVWSHFGQGYLFIPVLLPVLGLLWLRHTRR